MIVLSISSRIWSKHSARILDASDRGTLYKTFAGSGSRPQPFIEALGQALRPLAGITERFELAIAAALQRQRDDESQMESDYLGLKPLEQAVLWRMLDVGTRFHPYDAEALAFYRAQTGENVTAQRAQNALESSRQRMPALVWKSARGEYAADDAAMHRWIEARKAAGR